jgi:hypothetical protein
MCRPIALPALLGMFFAASACGSRALGPDGSAAVVDAATPISSDGGMSEDLAGGGTPDLLSLTGIACGEWHCAQCADQFCDTSDYGLSGTCRAHVSATAKPFGCDGPEDCGAGACCMTPDGSACSAFGFCTSGNVHGRYMCHDDAYCGAGNLCCPLASGAPYRACLDQVSQCP